MQIMILVGKYLCTGSNPVSSTNLNNNMKKLLLITFLVIGMIANAQDKSGLRFIDKEYGILCLVVDPSASIKEDGLNLIGEVGLVSYWKYVTFSIQEFTALEGGYLDACGGFGVNLTSDRYDTIRYYAGIRLGFINRGRYIYPLSGVEAGIDINFERGIFLRVAGTYDYRVDAKFTGGDPIMRGSGHVGIGKKF